MIKTLPKQLYIKYVHWVKRESVLIVFVLGLLSRIINVTCESLLN